MPVVSVLPRRVRELRDALAGRSQPRLDLRQVEDDLPVGAGVEGRRFDGPETEAEDRGEDLRSHSRGGQSSSTGSVTCGRGLVPGELRLQGRRPGWVPARETRTRPDAPGWRLRGG